MQHVHWPSEHAHGWDMARNTVISGARELLFSAAITKIHGNISIGEWLTNLLSKLFSNFHSATLQNIVTYLCKVISSILTNHKEGIIRTFFLTSLFLVSIKCDEIILDLGCQCNANSNYAIKDMWENKNFNPWTSGLEFSR